MTEATTLTIATLSPIVATAFAIAAGVLAIVPMLCKFLHVQNKYVSQKFVIALWLLLCTAWCGILGLIDAGAIAALLSVASAGYITTNIGSEHFADAKKLESNTDVDEFSRKYIIAICTIVVTLLLATLGVLSSGAILTPLLVTGGAFGLGNNAEGKILTAKNVK